jgi:hypothetical protein
MINTIRKAVARATISPSVPLVCAILAFGCPLGAQNILFQDKFDDYEVDSLPKIVSAGGIWTTVGGGSNTGAMRVVEDTENTFGYGTANRFLRIENGIGFSLGAEFAIEAEVVTMSFDFVDRRTTVSSGGAERLSVQLFGGEGSISNANRAHILSLQSGSQIRQNAGVYPSQQRIRFDVILNNSATAVSYDTPGGTKTLPSGLADVWIDGVLAAQNYTFARDSGMTASPIRSFAFQTFSADRFSVDLDNFTLFDGAHVLPPVATASEAGDGTLIELSESSDDEHWFGHGASSVQFVAVHPAG